jgi:glycosyltransferase involved in cell wall biosynthesis
LLVPPRDAQALSRAMSHVLENPGARKSMGEMSARRAVERFDVRAMTEAYEDLYRWLIAKYQSRWKLTGHFSRASNE